MIFDFSGTISPATDPFGRFVGYRNTPGGLARGLELSATASPTASLDVTTAYTYTNADQRQPIVGNTLRSFAIPDHQVSLLVSQRVGRRLLVNLDLAASSNYLSPVFDPVTFASRAYRFDGIAKADLTVSYRLPVSENGSIRFYGKVENLLDREYYENGFRTPGATALAGIHFEF
jgi:iron complex outermembrane receptor protein